MAESICVPAFPADAVQKLSHARGVGLRQVYFTRCCVGCVWHAENAVAKVCGGVRGVPISRKL